MSRRTWAHALGVTGSWLGAAFAAVSSYDYMLHLDRQLHGTHCSFVPGLAGDAGADNACTAAMYSAFSALFRRALWGGVPIAVIGLGAFAFFAVCSASFALSRAPLAARTQRAYAALSMLPLAASLVMFVLSAVYVGAFCKLCVGMYLGSLLLALAGGLWWRLAAAPTPAGAAPPRHVATVPMAPSPYAPTYPHAPAMARTTEPMAPSPYAPTYPHAPAVAQPMASAAPQPAPGSSWLGPALLLAGLGGFVLLPATLYAASAPSYADKLSGCGSLPAPEAKDATVTLATKRPKRHALLVADPLCPTCKALHQRLEDESALEQLEIELLLFPLDSECNWMLDEEMHVGACQLAKAVLCGGERARDILEWSYRHQDELREAGTQGRAAVRAKVSAQFPGLDRCIDAKATAQKLDRGLQLAVKNKLRLSTPQLYLGGQRICDEDTDLGLAYTLSRLAPEVLSP